jgi:hypothetical protein
MQSWLIDGSKPLDFDAELAAALAGRLDPLDGGGIALNLAILDEQGLVCRVARAWDLNDYRRATEALSRLGLVNTGRTLRLGDLSFEDVFEPPTTTQQPAPGRAMG